MSFELNKTYNFNTIVGIGGLLIHENKKVTAILPYSLLVQLAGDTPEEIHAGFSADLPADLMDIDLRQQVYVVLESGEVIPLYIVVPSTILEVNAANVVIYLTNIDTTTLSTLTNFMRAKEIDFKVK